MIPLILIQRSLNEEVLTMARGDYYKIIKSSIIYQEISNDSARQLYYWQDEAFATTQ